MFLLAGIEKVLPNNLADISLKETLQVVWSRMVKDGVSSVVES